MARRTGWMAVTAMAALAVTTGAAGPAGAAPDPGPFAQGRSRLSIILGTVQQNDETAWVVGAGYGYYLIDGLEVGAEAEHWFNSDPSVTKLSPQVRYTLWYVPVLKPYVGTFYRHWFVGGQSDFDSVGGRFGAFYVTGGGTFFGLGGVYEAIVSDCSRDCTDFYPEVALSIAF